MEAEFRDRNARPHGLVNLSGDSWIDECISRKTPTGARNSLHARGKSVVASVPPCVGWTCDVTEIVGSLSRLTLRIFGAVHVVMSAVGAVLVVYTFGVDLPRKLAYWVRIPHFVTFYSVDTAVSLACLVTLTIAAVGLWRGERRGVVLSNVALGMEVVWVLGVAVAAIFLPPFGPPPWTALPLGVFLASSRGCAGIALQVVTGYPLIALVGVNMAYMIFRHSEGARVGGASAESRSS